MNKTLKIISITILFILVTIFYLEFPMIGFFVATMIFLSIIYLFKSIISNKLIIAFLTIGLILFSLLFISTFERQARRTLNVIWEYKEENKNPPKNLNGTLILKLNSYTPYFDKIGYKNLINKSNGFFCLLHYTNAFGDTIYYEDKSGNFEKIRYRPCQR